MDAQSVLVGGVGLTSGVGATMLVRRQFDQTGETTILRPSVIFGATTGLLAMGIPYFMGMSDGPLKDLSMEYGEGALVSAAFSAFNPVGGGVQLPTV